MHGASIVTFVEASGTQPPPSFLRLFDVLEDQGLSPRFLQGTAQREVWLLMIEADLDGQPGPIQACLQELDADVRRWTFQHANRGDVRS